MGTDEDKSPILFIRGIREIRGYACLGGSETLRHRFISTKTKQVAAGNNFNQPAREQLTRLPGFHTPPVKSRPQHGRSRKLPGLEALPAATTPPRRKLAIQPAGISRAGIFAGN